MATIRKIDKATGIVFRAIIKDKLGRAITSKTFTKRVDATNWAKRIEADQEEAESLGTTGARMTFKQLCDEYMMQWVGKDKNQHNRVGFWADDLGGYRIRDITPDMLRQKLKRFQQNGCIRGNGGKGTRFVMNKPRKPATVNRHRTTLSGIFSYAVKQGYLTSNPVARTYCLKMNNKIVRYLSGIERTALLAACRASEWDKLYVLVLMAMTTGMRKSEIMNLRWADIDFNESLAFLADTKNGEPRVCPIPNKTMTELKKFRGLGDALLFPSWKKPEQPMEFKKHWLAVLQATKIERFRWHDLRHDFCSQLAMQGAGLHEIAELAGHKDLGTTKRYTHLSVSHKQQLVERIMARVLAGR